jgi:hypothetical protein
MNFFPENPVVFKIILKKYGRARDAAHDNTEIVRWIIDK